MENIISIASQTINNEPVRTVNARDLHTFLESKRDFSTWIKSRIEQYGFVENIDYVRFHKKVEANNATVIEYFITLDMAKELSMVERNEKGKEARQYFIRCEKEIKQPNFIETKAKAGIVIIESVAKTLNLAQSSTLGLYLSLQDQLGFSGLLPDYAIDASDKNAISSDVHHSLSHLLKANNIKLSTRAVYVALDEKGITCWQTRKRQNCSVKRFRSIANTKYGINLVNDRNKYETQPHFFDHNFTELMNEIGVR